MVWPRGAAIACGRAARTCGLDPAPAWARAFCLGTVHLWSANSALAAELDTLVSRVRLLPTVCSAAGACQALIEDLLAGIEQLVGLSPGRRGFTALDLLVARVDSRRSARSSRAPARRHDRPVVSLRHRRAEPVSRARSRTWRRDRAVGAGRKTRADPSAHAASGPAGVRAGRHDHSSIAMEIPTVYPSGDVFE